MISFSSIRKRRKLRLNTIIDFIRQKNIKYEIEGEIKKDSIGVYFVIKQKSTTALNTRQYIANPTRCADNFHTHPNFEIWPSFEDIMRVINHEMRLSVILTKMGCWILKNNPSTSHYVNHNVIRVIKQEYDNFFDFMNGYSVYKSHQESHNVSSTILYTLDKNVIDSITQFTTFLNTFFSIQFYPISNISHT